MSAHAAWGGKVFDSHADFYAATYAPVLRSSGRVGSVGATLMTVEQPPGDWSDAPTPDLVVGLVTGAPYRVVGNNGGDRIDQVVRRGDVFVQRPKCYVPVSTDRPQALTILSVPYARLLNLAGEDRDLPPDGDFRHAHARVWPSPEIARTMRQLEAEARLDGSRGTLWSDGAILQLVSALLRLAQRPRLAAKSGLAPWQVKRACSYMTDNLDQNIGLAELAALVGVSPGHFCTAFHRGVGLPPAAWLAERRIERAKEMMARDRGIGLTEVALAVGYGSHSAFTAAFRRSTGATPSAWRADS